MTEERYAESKMRVVFRVVAKVNIVLCESADYSDAESFCWKFAGVEEIHIEKVWVPKDV